MKWALVVATFVSFPLTAFGDEVRISIYSAWEKDLCPSGYESGDKCPALTGSSFDELVKSGRSKLVGPSAIFEMDAPIRIRLNDNQLSLARRYAGLGDLELDKRKAALLVAELVEKPKAVTPQARSFSLLDIFVQKPEEKNKSSMPKPKQINKRAFDHGSLRNLTPENRYVWNFRLAGKKLTVVTY